jgi:hypothetical protein
MSRTPKPSPLPRDSSVKRFPRNSAKSEGKSAMISEAKPSGGGGSATAGGMGARASEREGTGGGESGVEGTGSRNSSWIVMLVGFFHFNFAVTLRMDGQRVWIRLLN